MSVKFKKVTTILGGLIPTVLIGSSSVRAELIGPGGSASGFDTNLTDRTDLGGYAVQKSLIPYTLKNDDGDSIYTGHLLQEVLRDPDTGTLNFYFRFMNGSNDILGIDDASAGNFKHFKTDVEVLTDSGGESAPDAISRSTNGKTITYDFDANSSRISAGGSSTTFLVKTNATDFDSFGAVNIDAFTAKSLIAGGPIRDSGSATVSTFEPAAAETVVTNPSTPSTPTTGSNSGTISMGTTPPGVIVTPTPPITTPVTSPTVPTTPTTPGLPTVPPTPPAAVPLPSPFIAGGATMLGVGLYVLRLRRTSSAT